MKTNRVNPALPPVQSADVLAPRAFLFRPRLSALRLCLLHRGLSAHAHSPEELEDRLAAPLVRKQLRHPTPNGKKGLISAYLIEPSDIKNMPPSPSFSSLWPTQRCFWLASSALNTAVLGLRLQSAFASLKSNPHAMHSRRMHVHSLQSMFIMIACRRCCHLSLSTSPLAMPILERIDRAFATSCLRGSCCVCMGGETGDTVLSADTVLSGMILWAAYLAVKIAGTNS